MAGDQVGRVRDEPAAQSPGVGRVLRKLAESLTGLSRLEELYQELPAGLPSPEFVRASLEKLGVDYRLCGSADPIPETGPLVVVANHPFGAIEGLALADLLLRRRSDALLFANEFLCRIPELAPLIIPIDVFSSGVNGRSIRRALAHLKAGGALVVFPAGEVSRFRWDERRIVDPPWNPTVAMLARRSRACVFPVMVEGRAPVRSLGAGAIHPRLRTALLARDLLRMRGQALRLRSGSAIQPGEWSKLPDDALPAYLRMAVYSLGRANGSEGLEGGQPRFLQPLAAPVPRGQLSADFESLPGEARLFEQGDITVCLAGAEQLPAVLPEIARLRELSFRLVGEGTGKSEDRDRFDQHYRHLFLWHRKECAILGAYRLGFTQDIGKAQGLEGLYTHTLFRFRPEVFEITGPCIEMGRSFIVPEWQKNFQALGLLWKGIAKILGQHPEVRHLFGPVSISPSYSVAGRRLIAEALMAHYRASPEFSRLIQPRNPPKSKGLRVDHSPNVIAALADPKLLSRAVARIERQGGLPVLIRQYLELNGRFAGFNVDADFSGTLDGLVFVDVLQIPERFFARFGIDRPA